MRKSLLPLFACSLLAGCASVKQWSAPAGLAHKGKKVTASANYFSILFLMPENKLDGVIDQLSSQCGGGKVEGITVEDTRRFLFGEMVDIKATGYCAE